MDRKKAFAKICDKIGLEKQAVASMILSAAPGDEMSSGSHKIIFDGLRKVDGKVLYCVSLFDSQTLCTRVFVDIR